MPFSPLDAALANALVEDATAARSLRNAQPWKVRFLHGNNAFHRRGVDVAAPVATPLISLIEEATGAAPTPWPCCA